MPFEENAPLPLPSPYLNVFKEKPDGDVMHSKRVTSCTEKRMTSCTQKSNIDPQSPDG